MTDMNSVDTRSYAILSSLIDQPRHGYAILKQMEVLFPLTKRPAVATMYAALERLESEGLVEIAAEEIVDGRARRTFALTDTGRSGLEAEAERMADAARVVKKQLAASSRSTLKPGHKPSRKPGVATRGALA
jgi:DNA-binding PadR family transcriptional regulator